MTCISWWWPWGSFFREQTINFTIHEEPGNWSDDYAFYLMLGHGSINAVGYYFGLQTDVYRPGVGGVGKGILYSRWETRDLANARIAEGGWTQSSGHEGNFIGVRRSYDWATGDYTARLAPDGLDDDGEWYSLWITRNDTQETTWAGSLKFPLVNGTSHQHPNSYTTLEIYGGKYIRPIDIPEMHISMDAPLADGKKPEFWEPNYSCVSDVDLSNVDVQYLESDKRFHLRVGGYVEQIGEAGMARDVP